jgi:hypothetical protein
MFTENKIRVRMSLMPEKMRAILENGYQSYNKSSVPGEALNRILYAHQFQSNYLPRQKTEQVQRTLQSLTTEVSEEFKNKPVSECIFLTHNANLHKINLEKAF